MTQRKLTITLQPDWRVVDRDVKRVHEDVVILAELGLLERTEGGGVSCPFTSMHIVMYMQAA